MSLTSGSYVYIRLSLTYRVVEDFPRGYPQLSCFQDSDLAFTMYRRFGQLQSRVLHYKQQELIRMEEQLMRMDKRDAETPESQIMLQCWSRDRKRAAVAGEETRKQLMERIEQASYEYGMHYRRISRHDTY